MLIDKPHLSLDVTQISKERKNQNVQLQKIFILPPQKRLEFPVGGGGVGGSVRPKKLKKCMKLNWNFLSAGEVWIFLELELEKGSLHVHFLI